MNIGVIGLGSVTLDLAHRAAKSGFTVLMNNPLGNELLKDIERLEKNIKKCEITEAASAEIIMISLPFEKLEFVLSSLPDMAGKIILHANNPYFNRNYAGTEVAAGPSSQICKELLPGADLIKIYNSLHRDTHRSAGEGSTFQEVLFSGTSPNAKSKVKYFFEQLNLHAVDLEIYHRLLIN